MEAQSSPAAVVGSPYIFLYFPYALPQLHQERACLLLLLLLLLSLDDRLFSLLTTLTAIQYNGPGFLSCA